MADEEEGVTIDRERDRIIGDQKGRYDVAPPRRYVRPLGTAASDDPQAASPPSLRPLTTVSFFSLSHCSVGPCTYTHACMHTTLW
jgi:hypothetical protein